MELVGNFLKWVIGLGICGFIAWFIYQKVNEGPATKEDVRDIAVNMALVIGDSSTELGQNDRTTLEYDISKIEKIQYDTVERGICLLDPNTNQAQYIAAELILRRVFNGVPPGFESRFSDDPWEVTGDSSKLAPFSIDRSPAQSYSSIQLARDFVTQVPKREPWLSKLEPKASDAGQ